MKRFLFSVMTALFLALVCVPAMAQDGVITPAGVNLGFGTFAALVAVIPLAVEFIKRKFLYGASSLIKQIVSWVTGILITLLAWKLNLGFLAGLEWYVVLLYGLGASLAANGVFDTGLITGIIGLFIKKK
jgi:hypothetical protein